MQVLQARQRRPQVRVDDPELYKLAPMVISQRTSDRAGGYQTELHHGAHLPTEQGLNRFCSLNSAGSVISSLKKLLSGLEFPSQNCGPASAMRSLMM